MSDGGSYSKEEEANAKATEPDLPQMPYWFWVCCHCLNDSAGTASMTKYGRCWFPYCNNAHRDPTRKRHERCRRCKILWDARVIWEHLPWDSSGKYPQLSLGGIDSPPNSPPPESNSR